MRRLRVTGVNLRHRPISEKGRLIEAVEKRVWPLIARGRIKPVVGATVPFTEAAPRTACASGRGDRQVILTMR
jgi:NADPH2:quinone reductase